MTIYALSTPPGVSGIAIIRLSGTNALRIAKNFVGTIDKPRMAILKLLLIQNMKSSMKELLFGIRKGKVTPGMI